MKLALIGKSVSHSRSPELYKELISPNVDYSLIDVEESKDLPTLEELAKKFNAINITSPYKRNYVSEVQIDDPVVKRLGAINTIVFTPNSYFATNTDLVAVRDTLNRFQQQHENLQVVVLGGGVMAELTHLALKEAGIPFIEVSRKTNGDLSNLDLTKFDKEGYQTLIINACSRKFVFQGAINRESIFWDYNYDFLPHQNTLPFKVKEYLDGREMLFLQAKAAVDFWKSKKS